MEKESENRVGAFLIVFALALVPLIVSAKKYRINLNGYPWFSDADTSYDFFLYWKGQALILLCGLTALYVAVKLFAGKKDVLAKTENKYLVPVSVYFVMAILSTAFSDYRDTAIWGGYEQWEGMIILGAYVILFLMSYCLLKGKTEIHIIVRGLLAGVFVLAFLSAGQCFGHDFFRTPEGQAVMNFMSEKKLTFTFKFEIGRVYATLHNPNYVGSYVALMLPVILSGITFKKKVISIVCSVLSAVTGVLLVIMLFGSESVTGCIGILATLILFGGILFTNIKRHPVRFALGGVACVGMIVAAVLVNKPVFDYGINKIMNPTPNHFVVRSMENKDGLLYITTVNDDLLKLHVYIEDDSYMYEAADSSGNSAGIYYDESSSRMKFKDERFRAIEIYEKSIVAEGEELNAFVVDTPSMNKEYTVVMVTEPDSAGLNQPVYKFYNAFGKIDGLRHIEAIGFEENQHFGSRRGYIWSRTFPLLKKHVILGSGPNTFVYEFPNDDYVGLKNVGYDGATVTKPHNMFMQIFAQTGLISLLAFLALYVFYFAECIKLYLKKTEYSPEERFGIGIMLGTFGYLVTGLANDSTVAVAPLYWCLLGVGMAVNRYNRWGLTKEEGR